jgi:hypothetical protein
MLNPVQILAHLILILFNLYAFIFQKVRYSIVTTYYSNIFFCIILFLYKLCVHGEYYCFSSYKQDYSDVSYYVPPFVFSLRILYRNNIMLTIRKHSHAIMSKIR